MKLHPRETPLHASDTEIGARIRQRRQELALSQAHLARRLGVTFQQVQKYESGANRVSAAMLHQIAVALEAPLDWFFADAPVGPPQGEAAISTVHAARQAVVSARDHLELASALLIGVDPRESKRTAGIASELRGVLRRLPLGDDESASAA
jgi:transcriptional regulator with XRE-family HTH domain